MLTSFLFLAATTAATPICDPATAIDTELSDISIEVLEATLAEHRKCSGGQYLTGLVALRGGDFQLAIDHLEFARRLEPDNATFIRTLGDAYISRAQEETSLGDARRAKELYEEAVAADPDDINARASLSRYLRGAPWIAGGDIDEAMQQAKEIAKRDPVIGAIEIASTYAADDEPDNAWRTLAEASKVHPDSVPLALTFANMAQQLERFDAAYEILKPLAAAAEPDPVVLYQLGRTTALSGKFVAEGRTAMLAYIDFALQEDDPVVPLAAAYWRLGMIEQKAGDAVAARAAFEKGMHHDADYEPLREALEQLPAKPSG